MQSSQWVVKNSPRPKKARRVRSKVKVMLAGFFWHRGCCASWILTSGANSESLVLSRSAETSKRYFQEKKPQFWRNNSWFLHDDNAPAHASLLIRDFWPIRTQLCFLSHRTHLTSLRQTFSYYPNWNLLWRDDDFTRFKRLRKIRRQNYALSRKRLTRTVSRNGNGVGSGVSVQEGSTLKAVRLTQLHACTKTS
jgi:hypothetical protein